MPEPINQASQSSVPSETKAVEITPVKYSVAEETYLGKLKQRIWLAYQEREQKHDEFDGMTYLENCEDDRKGMNTYVKPKQNKEDTNYASGTIHQKLWTYLAALNNLDLSPDVNAFDEHNNEIRELGEGMEDILFQVGEQDGEGGDDEKKLLRQHTMLGMGEVFVREEYTQPFIKDKNVTGEFDGTLGSVTWTETVKPEEARCTRVIIPNENVILGSIRIFDMEKQPFIAYIEIISRAQAQSRYRKYTRWDNVPLEVTELLQDVTNMAKDKLYSPFHIFRTTKKEEVEVVHYQDRWNQEAMVLVNGVMMLDIGFPLKLISPSGEYDLVKQVNEVINAHFAYGKSLPSQMKNNVAIYDELIRMAVLKSQKSFAPPMANNTGKMLSSRIFAPGKLTYGIDGSKLTKIDQDSAGVTNSEFSMIEMMQRSINSNSLDPVASGQQPQGKNVTATQVLEVQRQAKAIIGLTVFVSSLLEEKLSWLRIFDLLKYWFQSDGYVPNQYTGDFIKRYRSVSVPKRFPGVGAGRKVVQLTDQIPMPEDMAATDQALTEQAGYPVKVQYLDAEEIRSAKIKWYVSVTPKEKKSDAINKVLFNEFMNGALPLGADQAYIAERYAEIWEEDPAKVFPNLVGPKPGETSVVPAPRGSVPFVVGGAPQPAGAPPVAPDQGSAGPVVPGANPSNRSGVPNARSLVNAATSAMITSAHGK